MLVRTSLNMAKRYCHHFTPINVSKTLSNPTDIFNTNQKLQSEIEELNAKLSKLQKRWKPWMMNGITWRRMLHSDSQ